MRPIPPNSPKAPAGRRFRTGRGKGAGPLAAGLLLAAALAPAALAAATTHQAADRAIHLLEYIAIDYPDAVRSGLVVNELEYREQLEFGAQVGTYLDALGVPESDPLRQELARLEAALRARKARGTVETKARSLAQALRTRFDVRALPATPPSLERGRALFAEACASCHGAQGRGDGPAGLGLNPPPADLTNRERMLALSPFALYSTISFGVDGTSMAGFADRFDAATRHDLAFFAGSLAFRPGEVERGRVLAEAAAHQLGIPVPDLAALVEQPANELASDPEGLAVVAYLRTHPEALSRGELPLGLARRRLIESWESYRSGDREGALTLAIAAYLDGFEHVETPLDTVDGELRAAIETRFLRLRDLLRQGRPPEHVQPVVVALREELAAAEQRLEGGEFGAPAVFLGSLVIFAREGLEAVLLVVALYGLLLRADRKDALRYVHAGWLSALVAGAATWVAAHELVRLSGAQREVIEGVSSLLATAILFYVSYWLVSKVEGARWQAFLDRRIRTALSRRSLWVLASVAFVAVYREIFETLLFYQALWAQTGPQGTRPILLGMVAGAALLAALATAVFRFGRRLPVRRFFAASSLLLYALAVVMAGHGIAALQEAGWIRATWMGTIRVEWLGIHPTAEGLALQGLLVFAAGAAIPASLFARRTRAQQTAAQAGG